MMSHSLLLLVFQLTLCTSASLEKACREEDIMEKLWRDKPEFKKIDFKWSTSMKPSPRSLFLGVKSCTEYYGNIVINYYSDRDNGFDEYVRYEDFICLKDIRVIHGFVHLNLERYLKIKTLSSILPNLREVQTTDRRGFTLTNSYIEMIGFTNVRLNVPRIIINHNIRLCYMERFNTINASSDSSVQLNKSPTECQLESKVCSLLCNPSKGCWGSSNHQCFECRRWRAGDDCVIRCESRPGYFTPLVSNNHVCVMTVPSAETNKNATLPTFGWAIVCLVTFGFGCCLYRIISSCRKKMSSQRAPTTRVHLVNYQSGLECYVGEQISSLRRRREGPGVELLVIYHDRLFSPVTDHSGFQHRGGQPGSTWSFIKCRIPGLTPGWTPFEVVMNALNPLFISHRGEIGEISQSRGRVNGTEVAQVTSRQDEMEMDNEAKTFSSMDGELHSWEEAGMPQLWTFIRAGSNVMICGGDRRTILGLYPW